MSAADQGARWSASIAAAFEAPATVSTRTRPIATDKQRADRAEAELAAIKGSPWWRASGPARRASRRLKSARSKRAKANAQTGATTSQRVDALRKRISTVLAEFDGEGGVPETTEFAFAQLTAVLDSRPHVRPLVWLTFIAISARYPNDDELRHFQAGIQLSGAASALEQLLQSDAPRGSSWGAAAVLALMRHPVIDVTDTATKDTHSGIQRVVRQTVPRWAATHELTIAVWDRAAKALRAANATEQARVLSYKPGQVTLAKGSADAKPTEIIVPWNTTVIVPELAVMVPHVQAITCLSLWSESRLSVIAYDLLPLTIPDTFDPPLVAAFARFMFSVRSASRISAISQTTAQDFGDFLRVSASAEASLPQIRADLLPVDPDPVDDRAYANRLPDLLGDSELPLVLSVGSIEPRKNQIATLRAAEILWREGLEFQLLFIGWSSWLADDFERELAELQAQGRPVRLIRHADDELLWSAYRAARFSVYVSLAEGYGLPAAESISSGTPVVLADIGSMAEIGQGGGAVMVDPRDVAGIADAMRPLLTENGYFETVQAGAKQRTPRSWDSYASDTWDWLTGQ